jgi:hypothetical protein
MSEPAPKLLFVYNARRGVLNGLLDTVHKTVSPDTYPCDLCAITYGAVSMDRKWKAWLAALPVTQEFRYRKDFNQDYPGNGIALPAIILDRAGGLEQLVSAAEFKTIKDVNALISRLEAALDKAGVK